MGIEPTTSVWKTDVLPLNYTGMNAAAHQLHVEAVSVFRQVLLGFLLALIELGTFPKHRWC